MPLEFWVTSDLEDWDEIDRMIDGIRRELNTLGPGGSLTWNIRGDEVFGPAYPGLIRLPPDMPPEPTHSLVVYGKHVSLRWDRIDNLYAYITRAVNAANRPAQLFMHATHQETIHPA